MREKICVYTCIMGDYDSLQPVYKEDGVDYICFTNNLQLHSKEWKIIQIEDLNNLGNMLLSREIKIKGHPYLKENYDISIWIDGSVQVKNSMRQFVQENCFLDKYNMTCFRHNARDCVYEEAYACVKGLKLKKEDIIPYLEWLEQEDFPKHYGLAECTILVRKHNEKEVENTMEVWFDLLKNHAKRDQLWFPISLKKTGLCVNWLEYTVLENPWFLWKSHKQKEETQTCRIFFGEYDNYKDKKYLDLQLNIESEKQECQFEVLGNCEEIFMNMGKHFGRSICDFKVNANECEVIFHSGILTKEYRMVDYDDVYIRIKGAFFQGQKIKCEFKLKKNENVIDVGLVEELMDKYYYDRRQLYHMQIVYNNKITTMNEELSKYRAMTNTPLFDKIGQLCERQDLVAKILRKLLWHLI